MSGRNIYFVSIFFTGSISFHFLDISKRCCGCRGVVCVCVGRGGMGCTVTNSGLWTICVFKVMPFKRPEMTFKLQNIC